MHQCKVVSTKDLMFLLETIDTVDAEVEQLEITEDWYSSDSRDLMLSAKEILRGYLGIKEPEEYEEEFEQATLELCS